MSKKASKRKYLLIIPIVAVIGLVIAVSILIKQNNSKKPPQATEIQASQPNNTTQTNQATSIPSNTTAPSAPTNTAPVPTPAKPTFTKSSGNNGPIPTGVNVEFTCYAEINTECSIILQSGSKQIVLGPKKIIDNGRGQYFTSIFWSSIKGSYKIIAQVKNTQGGISSSAQQSLEVQ